MDEGKENSSDDGNRAARTASGSSDGSPASSAKATQDLKLVLDEESQEAEAADNDDDRDMFAEEEEEEVQVVGQTPSLIEELEISDKSVKDESCIVLDDSADDPRPSSSSLFARADAVPPKRPLEPGEANVDDSAKKPKLAAEEDDSVPDLTRIKSTTAESADDEASTVVCSPVVVEPPLTSLQKRKLAAADSSNSSDPPEPAVSPSKKRKQFRVPQDCVAFVAIATKEEFESRLKPFLDHVEVLRSGSGSEAFEAFSRAKRALATAGKRVSDASSLSSSSGGGGYLADVGSSASSGITSGSSQSCGSKPRDRHSILPDLPVKAHSTVAPLPKHRFLCPIDEEVPMSSTAKRRRKPQPKKCEAESEEIPVVSPISDAAIESVAGSAAKRPLRRRKKRQEAAAASQAETEEASDGFSDVEWLKLGHLVFAKWGPPADVRYWPGTIAEIDDCGEMWIKFVDGLEKKGLKRDDVIPVRCLAPGHRVNVSSDDDVGIFSLATITTHPDQSVDGDVRFTVDFERVPELPQIESQMVSYRNLHLSGDQGKALKRDLRMDVGIGGGHQTFSADVSLDNLVSGKRRSSKKRGGNLVETSVNEDDEPVSPSSSRQRRRRGSKSDLFKGMTFVVTRGSRPNEDLNATTTTTTTSCLETEAEEEEEEEGKSKDAAKVAFQRRKLEAMIDDHGGRVLGEFPGARAAVPPGLVVVSDRHCLTFTYLLAVGFDVPRVSHLWVEHSVEGNVRKPMTGYHLPVGWSKLEKRVVEHHEGSPAAARKGGKKLFATLHALIASKSAEFGFDWKPLLARMGASVSFRARGKLDRSLKKVSVVVVDEEHPPESVIADARSKNVPVVNTDWVVESLLKGSQVPHDKFLHG